MADSFFAIELTDALAALENVVILHRQNMPSLGRGIAMLHVWEERKAPGNEEHIFADTAGEICLCCEHAADC